MEGVSFQTNSTPSETSFLCSTPYSSSSLLIICQNSYASILYSCYAS
uniref:Uncharacterized protein n=1 Tax=Arundo donax TaxID=35708 RepID=A0A0A8YBM7_ARUDO